MTTNLRRVISPGAPRVCDELMPHSFTYTATHTVDRCHMPKGPSRLAGLQPAEVAVSSDGSWSEPRGPLLVRDPNRHRMLGMPICRVAEPGRRGLATQLEDMRAHLHDRASKSMSEITKYGAETSTSATARDRHLCARPMEHSQLCRGLAGQEDDPGSHLHERAIGVGRCLPGGRCR